MEEAKNDQGKRKQGMSKALKALSLIREIGIMMVVNVLVGFFAGMYLDRWLGTSFVFLLIGTLLGMISGFRTVYLLIMKMERRGDKT